ncbi:hypothetical protein PT931_20490 [Longispora urticae]
MNPALCSAGDSLRPTLTGFAQPMSTMRTRARRSGVDDLAGGGGLVEAERVGDHVSWGLKDESVKGGAAGLSGREVEVWE